MEYAGRKGELLFHNAKGSRLVEGNKEASKASGGAANIGRSEEHAIREGALDARGEEAANQSLRRSQKRRSGIGGEEGGGRDGVPPERSSREGCNA